MAATGRGRVARAWARAREACRRHARRALLATLVASVVAVIVLRALPLPERLSAAPSLVIRFADGAPAHAFLSPDDKVRLATTPDRVDPDYVRALLRFEDKRFRLHPGVDPVAVVRAAGLLARHGEVRSGASTLTMQVVRILEPRPRTLRSKAVEAARALQLELRLSKDEILAAYLTFAPFGGNLEGVEAASLAYFGHGAADLSPAEIATLLAVPQSPGDRRPCARNAQRLREARDRIAAWLVEREALAVPPGTTATRLLEQVRGTPVPEALRPLPRAAPHAAAWLRASAGQATELQTTLDQGVQRTAERVLARARPECRAKGIHDASLVVVDHRAGTVAALVGNFDFWEARPGAQIAGFAEPRSPGSALKPFLFALALDRGLALPERVVPDIPVQHGSYAPENYGGDHSGLVRLDEALAWSLNVPFVNLLAEAGVESFLGALRQGGARGLSPQPGRYGLSAAVGGLEVTPLEVAALYAMLAEGGVARMPRVLAGEGGDAGRRAFSAGACWLTRRALARRDRPDFPLRRQLAASLPVHWKTGTSYGRRDAWAAGSGPRYTVVAWLGNFDNASSPDLVGAEIAAPVLFDVLEAIEPAGARVVESIPQGLRGIDVCADTGYVPGPACPSRATAWALASRVPSEPCPYHVRVDVDLETGLGLNASCREGRRWEARSFLAWPSAVRRWMSERHARLPSPPALDPACDSAAAEPPRILLPPSGQVVLLMPGLPADAQQVPFEAESLGGSRRHSWFVDGELVATTAAEERAWWTPEPGEHRLVVMDETGAVARQGLVVRVGG